MTMTATPITDRRTARAHAIIERGDVVEVRPGIFHVRDTVSGSGQWHLVAGNACGCVDARRGNHCKHLKARDAWIEQHTPKCPVCQGPTKEDLCWCGKAGWLRFHVCQANREHKAVRI